MILACDKQLQYELNLPATNTATLDVGILKENVVFVANVVLEKTLFGLGVSETGINFLMETL